MEDVDTARNAPGAANAILDTLQKFGLHSDEPVLYQSQRTAAYEEALRILQRSGIAYPCACSRKEIADSALEGIEGQIYPGTCRKGIAQGKQLRTWRVRSAAPVLQFQDALQGCCIQSLEKEVGDFVIKRADGLFAYQLAVVVDDAFQHITHVVRGADLLASTPRQIWLQRSLNFPLLAYMHVPIALNGRGEKLSKQTLAAPVDTKYPTSTLLNVLTFLRQDPPAELAGCDLVTIWNWAQHHWDPKKMQGIKAQQSEHGST